MRKGTIMHHIILVQTAMLAVVTRQLAICTLVLLTICTLENSYGKLFGDSI